MKNLLHEWKFGKKKKKKKKILGPNLHFEFKLNFQTTQGWQISKPILEFWGKGKHHYQQHHNGNLCPSTMFNAYNFPWTGLGFNVGVLACIPPHPKSIPLWTCDLLWIVEQHKFLTMMIHLALHLLPCKLPQAQASLSFVNGVVKGQQALQWPHVVLL